MLPEWDDRKVEKRMNINREEMLALTRRMTVKRTSMTRIAGCYADAEGFIDGTFNVNFLKLSPAEREKNLELAKTVPFAQTNQNLKRYVFPESEQGGMRQLLMGIWDCGLKNECTVGCVLRESDRSVSDRTGVCCVFVFMTGMTFLQRRRIRNDWENLSRCLSI